MQCATVKEGVECALMTDKGCGFSAGACLPVIEQCEGCARSQDFPTGKFCLTFPDPTLKWKRGLCNLATHVEPELKAEAAKINPLKASKRAARGNG